MFAERLKEAMETVEVTAADLARALGRDPSGISRLCSGARVPSRNGQAVRRLAEGLYLCADENGTVPGLRALIGYEGRENSGSAEELTARLTVWLFGGQEGKSAPIRPSRPSASPAGVRFRSFGEKFSALMNLADLSNVRMGKLTNLDASYISRFRSGLRQPNPNSPVADSLCAVLLRRIRTRKEEDALAALMKTELPAGSTEALIVLRDWLLGGDVPDDSPEAENLLENIDRYAPEPLTGLIPWEDAAPAPEEEGEDVLFGQSGLREAVLRFLGSVLRRGGRELLLYSDLTMDWMVGDPVFRLKWASLMFECVRRGVRIKIIHNLDRDPGEMTAAITNWLPLYMSGMIESFCCRRVRDSRFTHTLFLCPGLACVEGSNAAALGEEGVFRYHTDPRLLDLSRRAFDGLLAESGSLLRIAGEAEDVIPAESSGVTVLSATLSLATMPAHVLSSMLARCGADEDTARAAEELRRRRAARFEETAEWSFVHECIPTAEDDALFGGGIPADLPAGLFQAAGLFPEGFPAYTPQEYAEHVQNIIRLSELHPNYRFCPLPDAPFANTRIVLTGDCAAVTRLRQPCVTFVLSHPAVCSAFLRYAGRLKEQYRRDRITLKRMLERYL